MLSFKKYYLAEGIAIADLKKRYDKFNKKLFKGALPFSSSLKWKISNALKNSTAITKSKVDGEDINTSIVFSNVLNLPSDILDQILVHEMIHVFFHQRNDFFTRHGSDFRFKAIELGAKLGKIIPLTHDITDLDVNVDSFKGKETGAILLRQKGQYFVMFLKPETFDSEQQRMKSFLTKLVQREGLGEIYYLLKGAHPLSKKFPIVRKLGRRFNFSLVSPNQAEEMLKASKIFAEVK